MIGIVASTLLLSDVRLALSTSAWWYVLVAVLAVAFAWTAYRYTLPPVSRWRRNVLWILRGLALCMLLFLLFEPVLRYLLKKSERPAVALLIDNSASLSVADGGKKRSSMVRAFLQGNALRDLAEKADLRPFAFADSTREISRDSMAALSFGAVGTDLAAGWSRALQELSPQNVAAVIVVSDGAYNMGANPAREAARSTVLIYTLGVGDTTATADAVISEMLTNEIAYAGSEVPLDVRVHGTGLAGKSALLRLIGRNGVELERRPVRFDDDDSEIGFSFHFRADEPGDLRIATVLDSVPGEFLLDNNRRSVVIRVLEKRTVVRVFAGKPSADLTTLRQILESDTTLEVKCLVEDGSGGFFYGGSLPSAEQIQDARLIVLLDFPTRTTPADLLERLARVVRESRIPLLLMTGPSLAPSRLAALSEVLPITASRSVLSEELVTVRSAASHPALSSSDGLPANWTDLPPVFGGIGNFTVTAATQVLAKLSRQNLGIVEDEPGLVVWESGGRRGAAFLFWGTSRWRLQMATSPGGSEFYKGLLQRLRAWLVAPVEEQPVRIRPTKRLFSGSENIRFVGEIYGGGLQPRDDALVQVAVTSNSRTENVTLHGRGNGRYEGEMTSWTEGEYRFRGWATSGDDTLGTDRGMFAVEAFNIELVDTRARFDVLQQVSQASGGTFTTLDNADSVLENMDFSPRVTPVQKETTLWNRGLMIWLIIALLSLEWIIRKRSGML